MENEPKILTEEEIRERLADFPGWDYKDDKIFKTFVFDSFVQGLQLINKLAPFSERIDHHPDIHIFYKKILFELQRYSVGGKVTERDFVVAAEIERLFRKIKK